MAVDGTARDRIVRAAYGLFVQRGLRDVGVDEIIEEAAVAKATFYRAFPSKNDLVLAVLERREEMWTHGLVIDGALERAATPEQQLIAAFDVLDEWFASDDFDGCLFMRVLLEVGQDHPAGDASVRHLLTLRRFAERLARDAGLSDPDGFAQSWHIGVKGAIVAAIEGDLAAARRSKSLAEMLVEAHRQH